MLAALFPCGSVTGAEAAGDGDHPVEPWRDAYCGAIGWAAPDGRAAFNVAIRTVTLYPDGTAVLNVGGGVVADSTAEAEYEGSVESPFRRPLPADLTLIETFARCGGAFVNLGDHLARLEHRAAARHGFDGAAIDCALAGVEGAEPLRVRLTLALDGTVAVTAAALVPRPAVDAAARRRAARPGRPLAQGQDQPTRPL